MFKEKAVITIPRIGRCQILYLFVSPEGEL